MFNEIIIDDISKTMSFQPPASIRYWWLESHPKKIQGKSLGMVDPIAL